MRHNICKYAIYILQLIFSLHVAANAYFVNYGASATSMGGAFSAVANGADAIFWNPAAIGLENKFEFVGNYALLYSVDGLNNYSFSLAYDAKKYGAFSFAWNNLSLSNIYLENLILFGYSVPILDNFAIGANLKLLNISSPGYKKYKDPNFSTNTSAFSADLGILYNGAKHLRISFVCSNINSPKISLISTTEDVNSLSRDFRIGLCYSIQNFLSLSSDIYTDAESDGANIDIGSEVTFFNAIALRSGLSNARLSLGTGLFSKRWAVDFGFLSHKQLGNKYQFSLKLRY